jgi:hypothetical protein
MSQTRAVTVRKSGVPQLTEEDNSLYAKCVALSKSSAVPNEYISKPDKIFSTVVYGKEFGLGAMTSLCNIFTVNGKCAMNVHLMLGLCMKHKDYAGYEIKVHTDKECKIVMGRWNEHTKKVSYYEGSWSITEAVTAGLMASGMYKKYPKNMVFARALTFAMRKSFPDVLTGTYSVEEMAPDRYTEEDMRTVEAIIGDEAESDAAAFAETPARKAQAPKRKPVAVPPKKPVIVPAKTAIKSDNKIAPNRKS